VFDGRWRTGVERAVKPAGSSLVRAGLTADHLTTLGLVLAAATAVAIGAGEIGLGLVLYVASALPDLLDGAVAKASGSASPRGAFFDSVADRVSDSLVLGGVAWYLASTEGGHASVLPFAVMAASTLISYERARAESRGFTARGGLMERAERIIALSLGLLFSALLVPILWAMLALTLLTAVQRFARVWAQASRAAGHWRSGPGPSGDRPPRLPRSLADLRARRAGWRERRTERPAWRSYRRAGTRP
jgi:CDP-diacylglycerol--glycerol-3-phosphate 3-phosphatidyltransferase